MCIFHSEQGSLGTFCAKQNSRGGSSTSLWVKIGWSLWPRSGGGRVVLAKCVFFIQSRAPLGRSAPTKTVVQWLVSCGWSWHSHGSLIPGKFDLKVNQSMKTPWQEYSGVAWSYSLAPVLHKKNTKSNTVAESFCHLKLSILTQVEQYEVH